MLLCCLLVLFHEDDPKLLDRLPPVVAPAYRSSVDGPLKQGLFDSENVNLMSWLPLSEFGATHTSGNDCWGYTSSSGREYAIIGLSGGTSFVEVTDPGNAQIVQTLVGPTSLWRDIKVYQDYAYAVSEGGDGIQIFDLQQIDQGTVTYLGNIDDLGTAKTHNVAIDEVSGYLYRCGGEGLGLRFYSLADPANPTLAGNWIFRYVHDAQVVTYTEGPYAGRQIAFCCAGFNNGWAMTGLTVLDVTDKNNPVELDHFMYSTPSYSHQGWLSPDRKYFYLNDETDESSFGITTTTRILDVSNLSQPTEAGTFTNGSTAIDHNLYTKDDLLFLANYRSGLRVYHRNQQGGLIEVAFFDTFPDSDSPNYNGLWSSYPYFESGTIIGSDLERGLFVWQLDLTPPIGDLNGDFVTDMQDFTIAVENWRRCPLNCIADVNLSGQADMIDLVMIANEL